MDVIPYSCEYKNQLIELIDTIYHEYGYKIDLKGYDKDLTDIELHYHNYKGHFWLLVDKDKSLKGCIAVKTDKGAKLKAEFKRFYLAKELRGKGYADRLFDMAIYWCKENNINEIIFWSDTKFTRSHGYYLKKGFLKTSLRSIKNSKVPFEEYKFEMSDF